MRHKFRIHNGRIESDEEGVVQQIIEALWLHKIPAWRIRERIPGEGAPSEPGIPDLIGWLPHKHTHATPLFIEVKRPGKHYKSPEQIAFIEKAAAAGCVAIFAQDWDDVRDALQKRRYL